MLREAVRRQDVDQRERDARLDRESYAQAAEEMGISRAELDRAAAETHAATVARIRRGRRVRNAVIGAAVALLAAAGAYRGPIRRRRSPSAGPSSIPRRRGPAS